MVSVVPPDVALALVTAAVKQAREAGLLSDDCCISRISDPGIQCIDTGMAVPEVPSIPRILTRVPVYVNTLEKSILAMHT